MKIAYRIVTPILAAGAVAMGLLLKMFSFTASVLNTQYGGTYEFSIVEALQRLSSAGSADKETNLFELVKPMLPSTITFFVFLIIAFLIMLAVVFTAALSDKRKPVYILSAAGFVSMFAAVIASNFAFGILMAGEEISLAELVTSFSSSELLALGASFISLTRAGLGAGFYAMLGMFIIIPLWLVLCDYIIKHPIQIDKREYRRSKPMRKIGR